MEKELYVKTFLTVLFILSGNYLKTQSNLDSLYTLWQDQNQPDSARVYAYKTYIWDGFLFSKPDTAFILAEELINYKGKTEYRKAQALGYKYQGISWYVRGNFVNALDYYKKCLKIEKEIGDLEGINGSLNNIGLIYSDQGAYMKALDYFIQSLKIAEDIGDKDGISSALSNIGIIYIKLEDFSNALDYSDRSLKINREINDQYGVSLQLNNIGTIYLSQGDHATALIYYTQGLKIKEQIGDLIGIGITLNNIGDVYQALDDYPKALEYYSKSLITREQIGDQSKIAYSLNKVGYTYLKQKDYSKSLKYCQRGYNLAVEAGILELQKKGCSCLYETYKAMGNGRKALEFYEALNVIEDSLYAEETAKKLQQMEFQKAMLQDSIKKAEEARLVKESHKKEVQRKNRIKNVFMASGVILIFVIIILWRLLLFVRKSRKIIANEKEKSDNLLLNILPEDIAEELKLTGKSKPRKFKHITILFTDFVDFTKISERMSPEALVTEINTCYKAFDEIIEKQGAEKIKTIGDAYMAVDGFGNDRGITAKNIVLAAFDIIDFVSKRRKENEGAGKPIFEIRVGIHTGDVIAGIVGEKKFQFDIWGSAVNTASRMENHSEAGRVNISQVTYELLKDDPQFVFENRGAMEVKGKGKMDMWFVSKKEKSA